MHKKVCFVKTLMCSSWYNFQTNLISGSSSKSKHKLETVRVTAIPVWPQYQCGRSTGVAAVPVWPQYRCGRSTSAAAIPMWPQYQCGHNTSAAAVPVRPQYQCGRNTSAAAIPVWLQYRCGRSTGVAAIPVCPQYRCGRSTGAAAVPVRPQYRCGRNTSVAAVPVWPQYRCGRSTGVAAVPVWPQYRCGRNTRCVKKWFIAQTAGQKPTACLTQMYSSSFKVVVFCVVAPSRLVKRYRQRCEGTCPLCYTEMAVAGNNMFGSICQILRWYITKNSKCIYVAILTIPISC